MRSTGAVAMRVARLGCATVLAAALAPAQIYKSDLPHEHPAIRYFETTLEQLKDPASHLIRQINSGAAKLEYRQDDLGFLPSVLKSFGINQDSQALPFDKGSFQAAKISPRNPRAIYYADDVAVGWVRGGNGVEIASLDPKQGVIFYDVTEKAGKPVFTRTQVCLNCHRGAATNGVPGMFVGSVFP